MTIEEIMSKLTKDDRFDHMIWIGNNYSIRDLKNDLKGKTNELNKLS